MRLSQTLPLNSAASAALSRKHYLLLGTGLLIWGIAGMGFGAAMWLFSAGARKR